MIPLGRLESLLATPLGLVVKNGFWGSLARVSGRGLNFFFYILLARHLGVQDYGRLWFAISLVAMEVFYDFGLTTLATREIAKGIVGRDYLGQALGFKMGLGLVATTAVLSLGSGSKAGKGCDNSTDD